MRQKEQNQHSRVALLIATRVHLLIIVKWSKMAPCFFLLD